MYALRRSEAAHPHVVTLMARSTFFSGHHAFLHRLGVLVKCQGAFQCHPQESELRVVKKSVIPEAQVGLSSSLGRVQ